MKKGFFRELAFEPHELIAGHIYTDEVNTHWVYLGEFNCYSFDGTNHGRRCHFISEEHFNNIMDYPVAKYQIKSGNIHFYPDQYHRKDFVSDVGTVSESVFADFMKMYMACSIVSPIDKAKTEKVYFGIDEFNKYTTYLQNNPDLLFSTIPSETGKLVFTPKTDFYDADGIINENGRITYKSFVDSETILKTFHPYYYKFYLVNGEFAGCSVSYDCIIQFDVFHLN